MVNLGKLENLAVQNLKSNKANQEVLSALRKSAEEHINDNNFKSAKDCFQKIADNLSTTDKNVPKLHKDMGLCSLMDAGNSSRRKLEQATKETLKHFTQYFKRLNNRQERMSEIDNIKFFVEDAKDFADPQSYKKIKKSASQVIEALNDKFSSKPKGKLAASNKLQLGVEDILIKKGKYEQAQKYLEKSLNKTTDPEKKMDINYKLAYCNFKNGKYPETLNKYEEIADFYEQKLKGLKKNKISNKDEIENVSDNLVSVYSGISACQQVTNAEDKKIIETVNKGLEHYENTKEYKSRNDSLANKENVTKVLGDMYATAGVCWLGRTDVPAAITKANKHFKKLFNAQDELHTMLIKEANKSSGEVKQNLLDKAVENHINQTDIHNNIAVELDERAIKYAPDDYKNKMECYEAAGEHFDSAINLLKGVYEQRPEAKFLKKITSDYSSRIKCYTSVKNCNINLGNKGNAQRIDKKLAPFIAEKEAFLNNAEASSRKLLNQSIVQGDSPAKIADLHEQVGTCNVLKAESLEEKQGQEQIKMQEQKLQKHKSIIDKYEKQSEKDINKVLKLSILSNADKQKQIQEIKQQRSKLIQKEIKETDKQQPTAKFDDISKQKTDCYKEALKHFNKQYGLIISDGLYNKENAAHLFDQMAKCHEELGNASKAKYFLSRIPNLVKNPHEKADIYKNLGDIYFNEAQHFGDSSIKTAKLKRARKYYAEAKKVGQ